MARLKLQGFIESLVSKRRTLKEERQRRKYAKATLVVNQMMLESQEAALPNLHNEISHVWGVHDNAWRFNYDEGLERMKTFLFQNPRCDLRALGGSDPEQP